MPGIGKRKKFQKLERNLTIGKKWQLNSRNRNEIPEKGMKWQK